WMKDPRWAGTVRGHFHLEGASGDASTIQLDGGGHLVRADMFHGHLADADVEIHIANGSLTGEYNGQAEAVDTVLALANPAVEATLTGAARAHFAVQDLLVRPTTLADYTVDGTLEARESDVRGIHITAGTFAGTLENTTLNAREVSISGPKIDGRGSGTIELGGERSSTFNYDVSRADLSLADQLAGQPLSGTIE